MSEVIHVQHLSKSFRLPSIPRNATIKDLVIRTMHVERNGVRVDALKDVTFGVQRGSMLGILGRNGSGKTTLMRVLAGILKPDIGAVRITGSVAPLLALGTTFHPDLTGREAVRIELLALGFHPKQLPALIDVIVDFSEIGTFADTAVRTYSQGMLMRLAFSVTIALNPDVVLIDEILSVGDEAFARKCFTRLQEYRAHGKTIVLVTHSVELVERHCDVALWLDAGEIADYGDPAAVVSAYRALMAKTVA